jgi:hypothetical protein
MGPPDLATAAGAMLDLMRLLGTSLGVASASSMLSWRVQVAGDGRRLSLIQGRHLIEAAQSGLLMLAVFAALAGAILSGKSFGKACHWRAVAST